MIRPVRYTVRDLVQSVREGAYTSIGCYPKYYVTADGGTLSPKAVRDNFMQVARATRDASNGLAWADRQWAVIGCGINWEDPALLCDDTGERIPSAYAEDEAT
jgi:hypothetical protein